MNKLFNPLKLGPVTLNHRVVHAPVTRMRGEPGNVPGEPIIEYCTQRATDGGMLITEAAAISPLAIAYADAPGI